MMRRTVIISIVISMYISIASNLYAQQLICPPSKTISCDAIIDDKPVIENGNGYELISEQVFNQKSCEVSFVDITFSLVSIADPSSVADVCSYTVTINPYLDIVVFPSDTTISGYAVSEVYNKNGYTDGLLPAATNDCGIFYNYEDEIVELYPDAYIFRHWSAYNSCTDKTSLARQQIRLRDIPNNTISTSVYECGGLEILVNDIEIDINGDGIDNNFCFTPFDSLYQKLNCIADSLMTDTDTLSIRLSNILNPSIGIGDKDVTDIHRHILGKKRFEDACSIEAADVNQDGRINGIDLVELRKLMVGIYSSWSYGTGNILSVNGKIKSTLSFTKEDFPLDRLNIIVTNRGNPATNN